MSVQLKLDVPPTMTHASLACGRLQATLQPPQLESVLSGRSQPLPAPLSQSSQPASQLVISQLPVAQLGLPCGVEQALPHWPQFVSELSSVSQPLFLLPSQSPQPIWQVGTHPVAVQSVPP